MRPAGFAAIDGELTGGWAEPERTPWLDLRRDVAIEVDVESFGEDLGTGTDQLGVTPVLLGDLHRTAVADLMPRERELGQ